MGDNFLDKCRTVKNESSSNKCCLRNINQVVHLRFQSVCENLSDQFETTIQETNRSKIRSRDISSFLRDQNYISVSQHVQSQGTRMKFFKYVNNILFNHIPIFLI